MREFTLGGGVSTVTTSPAITLLGIRPPASPSINIEILRMWISQSANATSAQQRIQICTQSSSSPSFVAATPASLKRQDPNASAITGSASLGAGMCGINAATENAGGKTIIFEDNFNVLNGWLNVPTPPETIILPAGYLQSFGMFEGTAPATATSWSWGCTFREI